MIACQLIYVDNQTKRPFRHDVFDSGFETEQEANKKQSYRRSIGHAFFNGWHVTQNTHYTIYQRYFFIKEA